MRPVRTGTVKSKIKRGDQVVFVAGKEYNRYDASGKRQPFRGKVVEVEDSDALVPAMIALLHKMIAHFGDPATPYAALPWPEFIPHFNDYIHLERVAEWSAGGET